VKALASFAMLALLAIARFDVHSAQADSFGIGANTFNIDFVTIGNPGNAADTRSPNANPNPAGSVSYTYNMGKYDVSRDMITKANTLGTLGIPLADMTSPSFGGGGNGVNRPATGMSWNEAARFVNWLDTSTGRPPAYKFALQPGDAGYDSNANIQLWTPTDAGYNPANLYRNSLAHYFLPSVDEWYKAAFYDPTSGVYYDYPTGSNSAPTPVASGTAAGTAVYNGQTGPADITLAGGLSPYGTMGQGGNVYEWEETDFDLVNGPTVTSGARGIRGGDWSYGSGFLSSSNRQGIGNPKVGLNNIGFRVASTPEPSTLLLSALACGAMWWSRKRFNA
jgi:formylglycine-generating enzyme